MRVVETSWEGQPAYLASLREITDRKDAADALRFLADASRALAGLLDYPATIQQVARLGRRSPGRLVRAGSGRRRPRLADRLGQPDAGPRRQHPQSARHLGAQGRANRACWPT